MDKKNLRKNILHSRDLLSINEKTIKDDLILKKLIGLDILNQYSNISCYVNFGSEINTRPILEYILSMKKNLFVPYIDTDNNIMKFAQVKNLNEDLESGYYTILEPKNNLRSGIDHNKIELVITPGVAFSKDKYRTGYGGGFYDKFFASLKSNPLKLALSYDFQIIDEIPINEFDIPVDIIITEKQIIK